MAGRVFSVPVSEKFRGPRGERGEPFNVDASGPKAERPAFVAGAFPLSYLADDTGELSVKRATEWGPWVQFRGLDGRSAYEVWASLPGNEGKTEADFFVAITGDKGDAGPSAFQVWLEQPGNEGLTEADFFASLKGDPGADAYQAWLDAGNTGTRDDFLATLVGEPGPSAYEVWEAQPGNEGKTEAEFIESLGGIPGDSAYEVWLAQPGNEGKTEAEFFESLRGPASTEPGPKGEDGLSYSPDAEGTLAERATYDAYEPPFVYHVLDETLPEHDHFTYKRTASAGDWSDPYPRATPGGEGPSAYEVWLSQGNTGTEADFFASLEGPPGIQGPPGKTLYSGTGAPSGTLGNAGDHYLEKDGSTAVAIYGPKANGGWGTRYPLAERPPLRRAYLSLGGTSSGIGTTTAYANFNLRNVLRLAVKSDEWRVKIRNHTCTTETSHSGAIQITGGWFGKQLTNASNYFAWTGHYEAAPVQVVAASATPADGAEWVSPWITDAAAQFQPHTDHVLSLGLIAASGQAIAQASGRCFVNTATGASVAADLAPALTWTTPQPLSIVIEFKFRGSNRVVLLLSDSIGEGSGSTLGQRDSYLERWALANDGVAIKAGIGGATAANYQSVGYKYDRFSYLDGSGTRVYADVDAAMVSLGFNDVPGADAPMVQGRLQNNMRFLRNNFSPEEAYWGLITPRNNLSAAQESVRAQVNEWMAGLPVGANGAAYFNDALADWSDPALIEPRFDSGDGLHPGTAGHARMLAALPFGR